MNKTIEVFKLVSGYPAYRVSNLGRVQSRWQNRRCYDGFKLKDVWKDIKAGENQKGYMQFVLCDGNGKRVTTRVHAAVALMFIGVKPRGCVVRHLDSNPKNNRVSNLSYGTYLQNENDKIKNGTWSLRNGGAKLTPDQVLKIRKMASRGERQDSIAKLFKVSRPTVTRIVNNTIWKETHLNESVRLCAAG